MTGLLTALALPLVLGQHRRGERLGLLLSGSGNLPGQDFGGDGGRFVTGLLLELFCVFGMYEQARKGRKLRKTLVNGLNLRENQETGTPSGVPAQLARYDAGRMVVSHSALLSLGQQPSQALPGRMGWCCKEARRHSSVERALFLVLTEAHTRRALPAQTCHALPHGAARLRQRLCWAPN